MYAVAADSPNTTTKTMAQKLLLSLVILVFISGQTYAQEENSLFLKRLEDYKIQPILSAQLWASYTTAAELWDAEKGIYEDADDRINFQVRRIRMGFKAQPYENFNIKVVGAYDLIGRDILAGPTGGQNNGNFPAFGLWEAFFQWRLQKNSEAFYLVGGYFTPQFSRESFTSAFQVTSLGKAWSQNYIRRHLVGRGPGRTLGMNLGGLWINDKENLSFKYNLGLHNPAFFDANGNSIGQEASPLAIARLAISIGDPEQKKYGLGGRINYLGKRRGFTIGANVAQQGETDFFQSNAALGVDVLFNWDNFNLDAERVFLWREGVDFTYRSETLHARASYNLIVDDKYILEPSFMVRMFTGATDATEQGQALSVSSSSGMDTAYKASLNLYITELKTKVSLGYTLREGEVGDVGAGLNVNQLYFASQGEAIRRGNWLGLGLIVAL